MIKTIILFILLMPSLVSAKEYYFCFPPDKMVNFRNSDLIIHSKDNIIEVNKVQRKLIPKKIYIFPRTEPLSFESGKGLCFSDIYSIINPEKLGFIPKLEKRYTPSMLLSTEITDEELLKYIEKNEGFYRYTFTGYRPISNILVDGKYFAFDEKSFTYIPLSNWINNQKPIRF